MGQWLVLSIISFVLFMFFVYLTYLWTPEKVPVHTKDASEWIWWSTITLKRTVYYSLAMVFFFASMGLSICGILEDKRKLEHMKV